MDQDLERQLDLLDEEDQEEVAADAMPLEERLARIKSRLGIAKPVAPVARGQYVAFEDMEIPGAELVKSAGAAMARSFELVEIMHAPSVRAPGSPGAKYTVLAGRRRILGLMRAGLEGVECNVYAADLTDAQAAAITLTENHSRGAAWVRDVQAIAELLHVARLTIDDLAAMFGRARSGIAELARVAKLPDPLLEQIYAGKLSQVEARQLTRLRPSEVDRLAGIAAGGADITGDDIRGTLRQQWTDGLSKPLAQALDFADEPMVEVTKPRPAPPKPPVWTGAEPSGTSATQHADGTVEWQYPAPLAPSALPEATAHGLADELARLASNAALPARVRTLAKALQAELERL